MYRMGWGGVARYCGVVVRVNGLCIGLNARWAKGLWWWGNGVSDHYMLYMGLILLHCTNTRCGIWGQVRCSCWVWRVAVGYS